MPRYTPSPKVTVKKIRAHAKASGCDCNPDITIRDDIPKTAGIVAGARGARIAHDDTCALLLRMQYNGENTLEVTMRKQFKQ